MAEGSVSASSLRDDFHSPRRWTISLAVGADAPVVRGVDGHPGAISAGESVDVMPVSEHEEIVASLNVAEPGCAYFVSPAMKRLADEHERLREAAQAVVDALDFYDSTLTAAYRNEQRPHVLAACRDLRAALAPAQECDHHWIDVSNADRGGSILSGAMCEKCGALGPGRLAQDNNQEGR